VVLSEAGLVTGVAAALSGGAGCVIHHPKTAAAASAPQTAMLIANTLIREEFLKGPNILRGTSNPYALCSL
jgi:hypothetical protein